MSLMNSVFSMENISYSKNRDFLNSLTVAVGDLRKNLDSVLDKHGTIRDNDFKSIGYFSSIIKMYSGLNVDSTFLSDAYGHNAAALPPTFDRNNVLNDPNRRKFIKPKQGIKAARGKDVISGGVNLNTGMVYGEWAEVKHWILITPKILRDPFFTNVDIAAIILHEIGHLVTYYLFLGRVLTANHVLLELTSQWNKSKTYDHRVELLKTAGKTMDLNAIDPDALARIEDSTTVTGLLISEYANQPVSANGTELFDYRAWEALSDQYASRQGASMEIAVAVSKLSKVGGHSSYWSNGKHLIINLFTLPIIAISLPIVILMMLMHKPYDTYDPVGERLTRIRNDAVNAIKNKKMTRDERRKYQNDIEQIDKLIAETNDRESWLMVTWKTIIPSIRRQEKTAKILKDLEKLANNDLYLMANKLNSH